MFAGFTGITNKTTNFMAYIIIAVALYFIGRAISGKSDNFFE